MEHGFLSQKGSEGGGVKEKSLNASNIEVVMDDVVPSIIVEYGNASKEESTPARNAPGKSSYANVIGKPSGKKVNFRTLFTPRGNGIDVVIPIKSIISISEQFFNTAYGFFLGKRVTYPVVANYGLNAMLENDSWFIRNNPLILRKWHPNVNLLKEDVGTVPVWVKLPGVPAMAFSEDGLSSIVTKLGTPLMLDSYTSDMYMQSWDRSSYARDMIELRADMELKDNIVAAMPKITREGYYTCTIRVEYEWKPPRCACCKVFGHVQEECPKNIGIGETKNLKKTSKTPKASVSKKKNVESTKEVSKSNPFKVLTLVENDMKLGTNGGTSNLDSQTTNSSGSSFWNVHANSPSTTPIVEKIDKIEKLIIKRKVTLVDDEGKPLEKVTSSCQYDSEDEVASVDNEMANFLAKKVAMVHRVFLSSG
ncbi:putative reverse transcriptase domain-containing protein [Tanacetum coccineum]|uniref:Reverse transcriptase domain-containing protein n=1 Tax=Tanacetum coccineum TaxID=301880 RepID=A0ABQ5DCC0_9ASTR